MNKPGKLFTDKEAYDRAVKTLDEALTALDDRRRADNEALIKAVGEAAVKTSWLQRNAAVIHLGITLGMVGAFFYYMRRTLRSL